MVDSKGLCWVYTTVVWMEKKTEMKRVDLLAGSLEKQKVNRLADLTGVEMVGRMVCMKAAYSEILLVAGLVALMAVSKEGIMVVESEKPVAGDWADELALSLVVLMVAL